MEHEVYVPFSVGTVRAALAERERVARCVPGLRLDDAAEAGDRLEGRLRIRIGGSTITYRGSLTLIPQGDGFTVEGSGAEARGSGSAKLSLKLVPRAAEDGQGTRLHCSGTVTGEGRIADHEDKAAAGAGKRLLDRFCGALAESLAASGEEADDAGDAPAPQDAGDAPGDGEEAGPGGIGGDSRQAAGLGEPDDNDRAIPGIPGPEKGDREVPRPAEDREEDAAPGTEQESAPAAPDAAPSDETTGGVFETEVPPTSPERLGEGLDEERAAAEAAEAEAAKAAVENAATAEAAHARRTMIGRSEEEVDHAPPRGRYAPVPAPEATSAPAALRWAAPAAAAVLAGAVVLTRVLRRRG